MPSLGYSRCCCTHASMNALEVIHIVKTQYVPTLDNRADNELSWVSASHRGHFISSMKASNSGQRPILNY
jgi:hypothetical protein